MRFWSDIRGNIAITFAFLVPCLLVCLGMAVDYGVWINQKQELQRIADQAAMAAARELYLANSTGPQAEAVAQETATDTLLAANLTTTVASKSDAGGSDPSGPASQSPGSNAQPTTFGDAVSVHTNVNVNEGLVEVIVQQGGVGFFSPMFVSPPVISVSAVARAMGGGRVCVIGLDPVVRETIILSSSATINAERCGVFSNSTDSASLGVFKNARLVSELTCSAGGYSGSAVNYSPEPLTDCPPVPDPLASRPPPSFSGCDHTSFEISTGFATLYPGVYCGGLLVAGTAEIMFEPGVYVIKDGPLSVSKSAKIKGNYVGFYFTGPDSTFIFATDTSIWLTAPKDGPLAGILFYEDRNAPELRRYSIVSEDARMLVGTVYLPNGIFLVSAKNPVAEDSAYTAIVARRIVLTRAASLKINSDYDQTDIPVPSGLGDTAVGRNIVLTR